MWGREGGSAFVGGLQKDEGAMRPPSGGEWAYQVILCLEVGTG